MRILQYIILSALCSLFWPLTAQTDIPAAPPYTAEGAEAIAARIQHEMADPQYVEALALYQARDFGEAQKKFLPLAASGNSMAALYVWKCNPNGRAETQLRNTARKNTFLSFPKAPDSRETEGKEQARTWDPAHYLQMAAESDNPYALYIFGRINRDDGAGWVSRAHNYWQTRSQTANDPDAWFCLGFYEYYTWPSDFIYLDMYHEALEFIYQGALNGSEAAIYVLANSRATWLSRTFQEKHPDWEENLFSALDKLIETKHPHALYVYSQLKRDDHFLEMAANHNLYDAWVYLVGYFQNGGKPRPRYQGDMITYHFRDKEMAAKNAFYRNVLELYERGRTMKYEDTPYNGIQYQYASEEAFIANHDENLQLTAIEYEAIVGQARLWSKQNRLTRFIHPLMDNF